MKRITFYKKQLIIFIAFFSVFSLFLYPGTSFVTHTAEASVLGTFFSQTTIVLPNVPGAVSFNIYYKETSAKTFNHASRGISPSDKTHKIRFLKKNVKYQYKISALDANGQEFWWSTIRLMSTQRM